MADVFLSYSREDRVRAEQVARGLQQAGLEVFWDNEIPPGTTWADFIEQKLGQCKALIVLWSAHSTKSQWVREEARLGRDKGVLIPVMIDGAQPPFGFGEVQAADLSTWNGEAEHPNWRRFVDAVTAVSKREPRPQPAMSAPPRDPRLAAAPTAPKQGGGLPTWVWISGAAVGGLALLLVLVGLMAGGANTVTAPPAQTAMAPPQAAASLPSQPQEAPVNYQQQILQRLGQVEQVFASEGFQQVSPPASGQMPQGQVMTHPVTLNVGGEYRIIGVCDNDCGDLDLILFDGYNNQIAQDQLADATPVVAVTPAQGGQFTVQAVMHNCTVNPCYYALVLYGRPLQ